MTTRPHRRDRYDDPTRLNLLEEDVDELEAIDTELRASILAVEAKVLRRLNQLTGIAVGILTSALVTALSVILTSR